MRWVRYNPGRISTSLIAVIIIILFLSYAGLVWSQAKREYSNIFENIVGSWNLNRYRSNESLNVQICGRHQLAVRFGTDSKEFRNYLEKFDEVMKAGDRLFEQLISDYSADHRKMSIKLYDRLSDYRNARQSLDAYLGKMDVGAFSTMTEPLDQCYIFLRLGSMPILFNESPYLNKGEKQEIIRLLKKRREWYAGMDRAIKTGNEAERAPAGRFIGIPRKPSSIEIRFRIGFWIRVNRDGSGSYGNGARFPCVSVRKGTFNFQDVMNKVRKDFPRKPKHAGGPYMAVYFWPEGSSYANELPIALDEALFDRLVEIARKNVVPPSSKSQAQDYKYINDQWEACHPESSGKTDKVKHNH